MPDEASPQDPSQMDAASLAEHATSQIEQLDAKQVDGVTRSKTFREATAALLASKMDVPTWEWYVQRELTTSIDVPFISEAAEKNLFAEAIDGVGFLLEGLLSRGTVTEFDRATIRLLNGDTDVDAWLDMAAEVIDELLDIPWVPGFAEDALFDRGVELLAKSLHGLFSDGSENA